VSASPTALLLTPVPDLWSEKIAEWQLREQGSERRLRTRVLSSRESRRSLASAAGALGTEYQDFLRVQRARFAVELSKKREAARQVVGWIQLQAQQRYLEDGTVDHWASFDELLASAGDDCDGLELMVFHLLRDLGYDEEAVLRAIVYRPSDGLYHMVTLWFEDPVDPWVLDPTGAMTPEMQLLSDQPDWIPVRFFSLNREFIPGAAHRSRL